jgi:nitrogen fixation NifU-like protein
MSQSSDQLRELYQEVIIDHARNPRNFGNAENITHHAEGFNPLCGDQLSLELDIENNKIKEAKFKGTGCAISTASASLMTQFLKDKTISDAEQLLKEFIDMVTQSPKAEHPNLGKLTILAGVHDYPARVKCATLAWHTLDAALKREEKIASTE